MTTPTEPRAERDGFDPVIGMPQTHQLKFVMPACWRHWQKGHRWWCRGCDRITQQEMRDVVHTLWRAQGAGDRIVP